jgi:predicted RNA-binding Zn-ribbon protein involved in translation (DUF1610 family)
MSRTPPTPPTSAAQQARADWEAGTARYLTCGLMRADHPRLDRELGLYVASTGCVASQEIFAYIKQYNAQIQSLREEFGLPSWAPGSRLPERRRLLELMSDAHPVTTREQLDALRLGSLGYPFRLSDLQPVVVYRRLENPGLLLLGSDVTAMKGCIDVLDLREEVWMVSEVFDRKQDGMMPWDSLPRDVKEAVRARHASMKATRAAEEARHRAEVEDRKRRAELNRQRCAELVEAMKERDFACPHCHVLTRDFRFLPRSESFVCPNCARSSNALAFAFPRAGADH